MNEVCIIAGLAMAGWALRTFANAWLRRLGGLVILTASYQLGLALADEPWVGLLMASLWVLVPLFSLVLVTRRASFPLDRPLRYRRAPGPEDFPELEPLTEEFLAAGFEFQDDIGWDWDPLQQFTRLFVHPRLQIQGAIHLHTQADLLLSFISLTTRTTQGRRWTTWNAPFQSGLRLPPEDSLRDVPFVETVIDLLEQHAILLEGPVPTANILPPDRESLLRLTQEEGRRQVDYNLDAGLLRLTGDGQFSYSWKGCWCMARQFMIDLVRWS